MKTTSIKLSSVVGFKELRENSAKYIKRVDRGEVLTIMRRSKPIFKIVPVDFEEDNSWQTVVDFTEIDPSGVKADKVLRAIKKIHG